MTWEGIATKSV